MISAERKLFQYFNVRFVQITNRAVIIVMFDFRSSTTKNLSPSKAILKI